jgi:alkanesulfonate monooxygenase
VLVGYSSSSAEGFLVALHAAASTERLGYLIAHRPGFVAPTLMARKVATFDHLSGGRLAAYTSNGLYHHICQETVFFPSVRATPSGQAPLRR